jgi:DNA-binding transcriptional regulator YhcF (GntR family)
MADSQYWIKLWHEIIDDSKMGVLPDRLWRRLIELFLLAGIYGGEKKTGELPSTRQLAWKMRMNTDDLEMDLVQLESAKFIQRNGDGWLVTNFEKRQSATPNTERKRMQRERARKSQLDADNVTSLSHDVTRRQNTETESETEVESAPTPFSQLSVFIANRLGINEFTGGPDKWIKSINEILKLEVTTDDIGEVITDLDKKGYSITGPWSLENSIRMAKAKRERVKFKEPAGIVYKEYEG